MYGEHMEFDSLRFHYFTCHMTSMEINSLFHSEKINTETYIPAFLKSVLLCKNRLKIKKVRKNKMITVNGVDKFNNTLDLYGLSTDDLPTDKITYLGVDYRLTNGSTIYFMDSKQAKIFSEENTTWYDV